MFGRYLKRPAHLSELDALLSGNSAFHTEPGGNSCAILRLTGCLLALAILSDAFTFLLLPQGRCRDLTENMAFAMLSVPLLQGFAPPTSLFAQYLECQSANRGSRTSGTRPVFWILCWKYETSSFECASDDFC